MPTFSRFGVLLFLRRPQEPSGRPQHSCRPSPGEVEAGGHGRGRRQRKGPPRVEKRAARRGERSDYDCGLATHMYVCQSAVLPLFWSRTGVEKTEITIQENKRNRKKKKTKTNTRQRAGGIGPHRVTNDTSCGRDLVAPSQEHEPLSVALGFGILAGCGQLGVATERRKQTPTILSTNRLCTASCCSCRCCRVRRQRLQSGPRVRAGSPAVHSRDASKR